MNPIVRKDLVGLLRLRSVLGAHLTYIIVMALITIGSWPQGGMLTLATRGRNDLLLGLMLAQAALLALILPATAASAIAGERERNTFEMLQATRLSAFELVLGKLLSSLAYPLMLLVAGGPMIAMLCFRGDLDPPTFGLSSLLIAVTAILIAVGSLTVSSFCARTSTALVISYLIVLAMVAGALVPAAILLESQSGDLAAALHYLRGVSPVAALLSVLRPNPGDFDGQIHQLTASWKLFLSFSGVAILTCVVLLSVRLTRTSVSEPVVAAKKPSRISRLLSFGVRERSQKRSMNAWNPMLTKERRTDVLRSGRWMVRTFYVGLALSLLLAWMSLYGGSEHGDLLAYVARVITSLQMGMIALLTPSLTSGVISSEVEGGTLELLRMTPLSAMQNFFGKFLPALPTATLPIIAMVPAFLAISFVNPAYSIATARIISLSLLAAVVCCGIGMACSAWMVETSRATVITYLLVAAVFVLPLFAWLGSGKVLDPALAGELGVISPLVVCINLLPDGDAGVARNLNHHILWMGAIVIVSILASLMRLQALMNGARQDCETR